MIRLAAKATLSQMLERDEFHKRFKAEEPISVHEMLYPLVQGYDSVMLQCDVELGGTDQRFNLMRGRDLQRDAGQPPQIILMTPILEGLDGVQKMSKSLGNAIGIKEPGGEMYGKLMSISDELMWQYYTLLTDLRGSEIDAMRDEVSHGGLHPMKEKKDLAWGIVRDFHSEAAADAAAENWAKQFQQRKVAEDAAVVRVAMHAEGLMHISDAAIGARSVRAATLLVLTGLASSSGEATRKLNENAVSINGTKSNQRFVSLDVLGDSPVLRLGKKSVRVEWIE
jgi:tyrosyl-tRNA synthetase